MSLKTKTILFVDDDYDDYAIFNAILQELDNSLICIHKAYCEQAIEYLMDTNNPVPHFIFLDLNMPRLSGKDCLLALKKEDRTKDIPVVIYTTSNRESDREEMIFSGSRHFITKGNTYNEQFYVLENFHKDNLAI